GYVIDRACSPTRRSSDLGGPARRGARLSLRCLPLALVFRGVSGGEPGADGGSAAQECGKRSRLLCIRLPRSGRNGFWGPSRPDRSEEHTSELQSREILVC